MNRENLETRIKELGVLIEEASGNVKKLVDEQNTLTQNLEDLNKTKLTTEEWDKLEHIITCACEAHDMDVEDCEYELELNYDNRIVLNHFDWSRAHEDLIGHIMDRVRDELFGQQEFEE